MAVTNREKNCTLFNLQNSKEVSHKYDILYIHYTMYLIIHDLSRYALPWFALKKMHGV